jgi:WD40-like Beta Propeller Repeat
VNVGRLALILGGTAAAVVALLLVSAGLSSAGARPGRCADSRQAGSPPPALPVFAAVDQGSGLRTELVLRSAASGTAVRKLASFGNDFTNNGLALSPDGREVYFTLIPPSHRWSNLVIERLDVRTGKRSPVAAGWEPSLSPNGRLLAYIREQGRSESVAVENLSTSRTRAIGVDALVGRGHVLAELQPGWLNNATLAIPITTPAIAVSASARTASGTSRGASAPVRMILVRVDADQPLSAMRVLVAGLRGEPQALAQGRATSALIAASPAGTGEVLDEVRFSGNSAFACRLVDLNHGLVLGFDRSGADLLYLLGSDPPALWRATIEDGKLIARRLLLKNSDLEAVAW